jgi:hypothetical protein
VVLAVLVFMVVNSILKLLKTRFFPLQFSAWRVDDRVDLRCHLSAFSVMANCSDMRGF